MTSRRPPFHTAGCNVRADGRSNPGRPLRYTQSDPLSLTTALRRVYPLSLDFVADPAELAVAVVQCEVLVEAAQHHREVLLLLASCPMSVSKQPLAGARNFLQLLVQGMRIRAKRPARSAPQTCLRPRNSNVSGLCPCLNRSTAARHPKSNNRVLSSASSRLNCAKRSRNWRGKFCASPQNWKLPTKSSAKRTKYALPWHCALNFFQTTGRA
jgi:hypothetical protein